MRSKVTTIYPRLKPGDQATLYFGLSARGDLVEAERVIDAVERRMVRTLHPHFTDRADALDRLRSRWAIRRLHAEAQALRVFALMIIHRYKVSLANSKSVQKAL